MLICQPQELPRCYLKLATICESQGETKGRGRSLQSGVGVRFNKQGNLLMRLVLRGQPHEEQISAPACQTLKVHIEFVIGFSRVYHPDNLNTTFLAQGCTLGAASGKWEGKQNTFQGQGTGWEASNSRVRLKVKQRVMSSQ